MRDISNDFMVKLIKEQARINEICRHISVTTDQDEDAIFKYICRRAKSSEKSTLEVARDVRYEVLVMGKLIDWEAQP